MLVIVAGSVPVLRNPATGDTAVLLCRRAIPPRVGFWNLPAGYMEKGSVPITMYPHPLHTPGIW
jgi:ADP-ribose pyrophosphatase YjhB (NUDIX family)